MVAFSRLLERQRTHVNGLLAETESAQPGDKHYHFPGLGNRPHSVSTNRYANRFEISCPRAVQADCYVGRTLARQAAYPFGAIARLLMLTGRRREEVVGMTWGELSEDLVTGTIPATRTKNGIPHLVPLSQPARELLHALPSDRPGDVQGAHRRAKLALVFPGERGTPFSGWSKAKSALDTASGVSGWWLHDLRRTLATGLQRLGVRLEVTEAVLNHLSGSRAGVVGIYQRHDWAEEKRSALGAWSAHLLAVAEGRLTAGKVLPFSRAGSGEI